MFPSWKAEYFNNNNLEGAPEKTICVVEWISHEWGAQVRLACILASHQ
jgi:hypothetical protein